MCTYAYHSTTGLQATNFGQLSTCRGHITGMMEAPTQFEHPHHVERRLASQITIVMADVSGEDCMLLISPEVRLAVPPSPFAAHRAGFRLFSWLLSCSSTGSWY